MAPVFRLRTVLAAACGAGGLAWGLVAAEDVPAPGRGALLYETHCKACHGEQLHWRDKRVATDWRSLKEEVARWQAAARLGWNEADIVAVARHLNETVYHLPQSSELMGGMPPGRPALPLRVALAARGAKGATKGAAHGAAQRSAAVEHAGITDP